MLRFMVWPVVGLVCLSASIANAQTQATQDLSTSIPASATAADSETDSQKVICRAATPPTGTRIRGRSRQQLCMTKADWEIMEAEAQAEARANNDPTRNREFLNGGSTTSPSGPR